MKLKNNVIIYIVFLLRLMPISACEKEISLKLYRPENHGIMNTIPCIINIVDEKNLPILGGTVTNLDGEVVKQKTSVGNSYLIGGDSFSIKLPAGIYNILLSTPVDLQEGCELDDKEKCIWLSKKYILNMLEKKDVCLYILAETSDFRYLGRWLVVQY